MSHFRPKSDNRKRICLLLAVAALAAVGLGGGCPCQDVLTYETTGDKTYIYNCGKPLAVYNNAGNTFTENELKDMSLEQINQGLANRTGKGNLNVNVKPQASVPFMIVFEELPDNLSEFTVEAVSSAAGQ